MVIHLSGPPGGGTPGGVPDGPSVPLFDLAPGGVYRAGRVTPAAGALLPHRFTLTCALPGGNAIGGLFSVALSCRSPRLAVSQHPALWSPDLPRSVPGRGVTPTWTDRDHLADSPSPPSSHTRPCPRPPGTAGPNRSPGHSVALTWRRAQWFARHQTPTTCARGRGHRRALHHRVLQPCRPGPPIGVLQ